MMSDRYAFIEKLGEVNNKPRGWFCEKHKVNVSKNSPCPLCELELLKEKRQKEIEEINLKEELTNPHSGLKRSVKNKPNYWKTEKQKRREAQKRHNEKKGKEYWQKISKENWKKVKVRKLERRSMFGSII